ncbi:hypothetical protein AN216_24885 [Streptomyces oceani]|uniref:DUF4190 domain-containing protein n=2 Tax=Streptomyces oceani TaxID=1075402 RepID=A0A1E7JRR3_9ACTN|nr:hypothetical protein AN216_24885 [Streptomyces oceani]
MLPTGQSTAAMVLGIVSMVLVLSCYGALIALITSPIALGLGLAARRKVERGELGGHSQAMAGFVMGIIGLVLSLILMAILVFAVSSLYSLEEEDTVDHDPGYSDTYDAGTATHPLTGNPRAQLA